MTPAPQPSTVAAVDTPPAKEPRKAPKPRARPQHTPVLRADLLASNLTASKAVQIDALFTAWSRCAKALGAEQWKLFFTTGSFNKNHDVDKVTYKALIGTAGRVQMCRYAVVGQLQGWLSNRVNDFRRVVSSYEGQACAPGGMLDPGVRHMLYTINVRKAWFDHAPIVMPQTAKGVLGGVLEDIMEDVVEDVRNAEGVVVGTQVVGTRAIGTRTVGGTPLAGLTIPDDVRKLARSIMRAVMAQHRRPNLAHMAMVLDVRGGAVLPPRKVDQKGKVAYWAKVSTLEAGQTIDVPLLANPHHMQRKGTRTKGIAIHRKRSGGFGFAVVTDTGSVCAQSREAYAAATGDLKAKGHHPDGSLYQDVQALDFGLTTLFGTSEGQLLGLEWGKRLRAYDARIQKILKGVQRRGGKPRDNARYRAAVQDLQGWMTTEINRVLNRLVATRMPVELVFERLDFRNPTLSRRMNRLVSNCGRAVFKTKLQDITQRFGIKATEVNPAYTSQTCSRPGCGYVDKRNRTDQRTFQCLWCGHTMHADLNASVNLLGRRATPDGGLWTGKAATLTACVRAFGERKVEAARSPRRTGDRGVPDGPRLTNPYFAAAMKEAQASTTATDNGDGKVNLGSEVGETQAGPARAVLSQ